MSELELLIQESETCDENRAVEIVRIVETMKVNINVRMFWRSRLRFKFYSRFRLFAETYEIDLESFSEPMMDNFCMKTYFEFLHACDIYSDLNFSVKMFYNRWRNISEPNQDEFFDSVERLYSMMSWKSSDTLEHVDKKQQRSIK